MNKTLLSTALSLSLVLGAAWSSAAHADSAKASVQVADVALLAQGVAPSDADGWSSLLTASLRTANASDVLVAVTLEAGLFTSTKVSSKNGKEDTSTAEAQIEVRVLIDGTEAAPGEVTFARRHQSLMARFGGIIEQCADDDGNGIIVVADECLVTDEELTLILDTMSANAFDFVLADLRSGIHDIEVQARLTTDAQWEAGAAEAGAVIGKGSLVVEEVRMVKDLDITL